MANDGDRPNIGSFIVQLVRDINRAQRERVKAEMLVDVLDKAREALTELALSPATAELLAIPLRIGKDKLQTLFDEARLSPCEAALPAQHTRQAYDAFDSGIVALRGWAWDWRFLWLPIPFRRLLEVRVTAHEIRRQVTLQVTLLEGLFVAAQRAAELGTVEILRLRDARAHLGVQCEPAPHLSVPSTDFLTNLPKKPFCSERDRVIGMRRLLLRVTDQLKHASKQGRKTLENATFDKEWAMVRPAAVSAVLADLNYTLACGILTCAALKQLASEPVVARLAK